MLLDNSQESMKQQEEDDQVGPMPVIPRLERLDLLLNYLEEKRNLSGRFSAQPLAATQADSGEECKPLASALQEVPFRGSLIERVAMLENRVLKLGLEMEEEQGLSSRRTSETANTKKDWDSHGDNIGCQCHSHVIAQEDRTVQERNPHKKQNHKKRDRHKIDRKIRFMKWFRWIELGC